MVFVEDGGLRDMTRLARIMLMLCGVLVAAPAGADPCGKPASVDDLRSVIAGLGYDVGTEGGLLKIKVASNYNYPVYFSISADKADLVVFTVLEDLPEDKTGKLPAVAILRFNDAHFDYLSLNKRNDAMRFVMQTTMPLGAANSSVLKAAIGRLIEDSNTSDMLWNPSNWN
jgi:hypothetical protein